MIRRVGTRITLLTALILLFGLGVMFFLRRQNVERFQVILEERLYHLRKATQSIIALKSQSLNNFTFDYTYWDEMVEFLRRPDPEWARINLEEAISPFKINAVWVFNLPDRLLYTTSSVEDPEAQLIPIRALEQGLMEKGYFHHFYQWGSQGVWEFSTAPIQPSADIQRQTPPQGYLFTARLWSSQDLQEIASITESQVKLVKPSDALPAPGIDLRRGLIITYLPLTSFSQDTVAFVKVEHIDEILQNNYHTMTRDQLILIFVGIVFLILLTLLQYYWITQPLEVIAGAIRKGSSQEVIPLTNSPTEFGEIANLWLEYLQQTEALRAAELRYRTFVELTSEGICRWDIAPPCPTHLPPEDQILWIYKNGTLGECNDAFAQSWGMKTAQEAIGKSISAFINLDNPQDSELLFRFVNNQYRLSDIELEKRVSEETVNFSLVSLLGIKDESGVHRIWGVHHDITALKRTQEQLRRITRLYFLLSETNRLITAVRTPEELYRQIVHLAVEKGGYKMAWIGLVDPKAGKIKPVASAGDTDRLIEEIPLSVQENSPLSRLPIVLAYRRGEVAYSEDIRSDPLMESYRDEALAQGYFSSAAIPIKIDGRVIAILTLYSSQPHHFSEEEQLLLQDISRSLTYAIQHLEEERIRREAEEALKQSRARLAQVLELAPAGVLICDSQLNIIYSNPRTEELLDIPSDQILNRPISELLTNLRPLESVPMMVEESPLDKLKTSRQPIYGEELSVITASGKRLFLLLNATPILDSYGNFTGAVVGLSDITHLKELESQVRSSEGFLRHILDFMPVAVFMTDKNGTIIYANPQSRQLWGDIKFVGPEGYHLYKARFIETGMEVKADQWASSVALRTGKPVLNQELEIETFDGARKVILNSAIPITLLSGEVSGTVGINYDITELKIAYQKLSESERQYRRLVENAPFVIYCLNREGKITQLNPAFERILGWKRDDWLGKEFTPLVHPDDLHLAQELVTRIFNGETPPAYHLRILCRDGSYRTGQIKAMPVIENGQVVAKFGIAQDITELMELYQKTTASEELFEKLVNSIPQGVALLDKEIKIRFVNQAAAQILEAPHPQSFIGMTGLSFVHPDYLPQAKERTQRVLTQREIAPPVMSKWKTYKGEYKDIETTSVPYLFPDGEEGMLVIFTDLTPLRLALQQKEYSEALFHSIIEESGDGIYLLYKGRFEIANRQFFQWLEMTPEEVRAPDFDFMELVAPESRPIIQERMEKIARGESVPDKYEFIGMSRSGKKYHFEASVSYIPYQGDFATLGIIRDITQRKILEQQIIQANQLEAVMRAFAFIAHDFNNLLAAIQGTLDLISMEYKDHYELTKEIEALQPVIDQSTSLVRSLLAVGRIQNLQLTSLNLNQVVLRLETILKRILPSSVNLEFQCTENLPYITADATQIEAAIINLINNSRDAITERASRGEGDGEYKGQITIRTGRRKVDYTYLATHPQARLGDFVYLSVTDNGCGMTPEIQMRVLEPFFTTKEPGKGTGLGLPSVNGMISQLGGFLTIYSEVGVGTTVKLYFPVSDEAMAVELPPQEKVSESPQEFFHPENYTILIVDDEPAVLDVAARILRLSGYRVLTATDGKDALETLNYHPEPIHLIISDIQMPGMGGKELARQVAQIRPEISIAFSSGFSPTTESTKPIPIPDVPMIPKPYRARELAEFVKNILLTRRTN